MSEKRIKVSIEDTTRTLIYVQEAIINVLEDKGIATRQEIMEAVKTLALSAAKQKH